MENEKKVNQEKNQHSFSTEFQPDLEVNFAKNTLTHHLKKIEWVEKGCLVETRFQIQLTHFRLRNTHMCVVQYVCPRIVHRHEWF